MIFESFLLGLSTGAACLFSCGSALIPYLLGERQNLRRSYCYLGKFLGGRLVAYLLIGLIVGMLGRSFDINGNSIFFGIAYCLLAAMMIAYGFHRFKQICLGVVRRKVETRMSGQLSAFIPFVSGFLASLNICPPLLLTISSAGATGDVMGSMATFALFFAGTTVYFLPLPAVALFRRNRVLQIIGKYSAIIAGVMFFCKGIAIIIKQL